MRFVIAGILVEVILVLIIVCIYRNVKLKKEGIIIVGRNVNYSEVIGRPTLYIITVQYELDGKCYRKKVTTTDARARKFEKETDITLLYVQAMDKVFWAEENKSEVTKLLVVLKICAVGIFYIVAGAIFVYCVGRINR